MNNVPNYAAECAIKCGDERFQRFLSDATKMEVGNADEAAKAVRVLCKITSRRELNEDPGAVDRWRRAKALFQMWKDGVGKNAVGGLHKPTIMGQVAFHRGTTLGGNPFPQPRLDAEDEEDFDLWEAGWRKAHKDQSK